MAKCMQCGGPTKMKKMQKGGSAEIVGMPKYGNNPRTSTGAMLKKGGSVAKAKFGATVAVQRSPRTGKVTGVDGGYAKVGQREPARNKFAKGGFPDLNKDGKITKADILKGRGVIKRKGGAIKKK
jgi:hypothetical protein